MQESVRMLFSPPGLSGLGISDTDTFDGGWIEWVFLSRNKDASCERWSSCRRSVGLDIAECFTVLCPVQFLSKIFGELVFLAQILWLALTGGGCEGNRILKIFGSFDFEQCYSHFINGCFHFVCNLLPRSLLNTLEHKPPKCSLRGNGTRNDIQRNKCLVII